MKLRTTSGQAFWVYLTFGVIMFALQLYAVAFLFALASGGAMTAWAAGLRYSEDWDRMRRAMWLRERQEVGK